MKRFGRKGHGPGEITFASWMMRCGELVYVYDLGERRVAVFTTDGALVRTFRFSIKPMDNTPYRSACNSGATFVHYGWEADKDTKAGRYRALVPLWTSAADSMPRQMFGTIQSSERWGAFPMPLGREPRIAIGHDRVYVGEAVGYDIKVFNLRGNPLASMHKSVVAARITAADVATELEREVSMMGEKWRTDISRRYASIAMPDVMPPYRAMVVDATEHLWVQDYAPVAPRLARWTVFSPLGKLVTEINLPLALDVCEIGDDYVLGRYVDPDEAVPEVRLYHLSRRSH